MNRWGGDLVVLGSGVVGSVTANESVGWRFGGVGEVGGGVCHCK